MRARRITVVASELLGAGGVGGAGTADSLLAVALGRAGHDVELLFARAQHVGALSAEWEDIYASSGVRVRGLDTNADIDPPYLAPTVDVLSALRSDPPEVVIANDWRGLLLAPLRARQVGRAFAGTAFVILCHGPSTVLVEFSQKVPDTLERFAMDVAERTAIGLADEVVSPSAWLLEWMRSRAWPVPDDARVVQYLSQATALGETPPRAVVGGPVRRLAFFGQMREGKGVRILLDALNALEPELLDGKELLFLGRVTRRWTPESVTASLAEHVKTRVSDIRFETSLERSEALAELRVQGTLALMPSLLDNSPNTVSECVEQGIPFIASTAGGIPELVDEADHPRVLVDPTGAALLAGLRRALSGPDGFAPARPGRDPRAALESWLELVDSITPPARGRSDPGRRRVSLVTVGGDALVSAAEGVERATESAEVEVVVATTRAEGVLRASGDWVVIVDDGCRPDEQLIDVLIQAQTASDADVVTCALRVASRGGRDGLRLTLGDAGSLGLIENHYGSVALVRRSLLDEVGVILDGKPDPDWPLLASLVLSGARVAAVPEALGSTTRVRGTIRDVPGYGLVVLNLFERSHAPLPDLPLLAATLGSAHFAAGEAITQPRAASSASARVLDAVRREGIAGVARRASRRLRPRADSRS